MQMKERQDKIIELVSENHRMDVVTLANILQVSQVTVRKDLDVLVERRIIQREHGYAVINDSLPAGAEVSFINANDGTCEGLGYVGKNIFTVQFHPEASPGPVDSDYLFDEFMDMIALAKKGGIRHA